MMALVGDMEGGARSRFQIVIRLQLVRAHVHDCLRRGASWEPRRAEIKEILTGIQGVAVAAREAGLSGFTSVCLHVCERIEPFQRSGSMPRATLGLVAEWAANSELYLRRPQYTEFARALVLQLNDGLWGSRLNREEQNSLIRAMLERLS
jgi:hypothetical protein